MERTEPYHECQERRDHDSDCNSRQKAELELIRYLLTPMVYHSRKLEAETFAKAGSCLKKHIMALKSCGDHLSLN